MLELKVRLSSSIFVKRRATTCIRTLSIPIYVAYGEPISFQLGRSDIFVKRRPQRVVNNDVRSTRSPIQFHAR
jgi:hypothetical protein